MTASATNDVVSMILQCEKCNARYLVPDQAIGASGRTVRCAKCGHTWFENAPAAPAEPLSDLDTMLGEIRMQPRAIPPGSNLPAMHRKHAPVAVRAGAIGMGFVAALLALLISSPGYFGYPPSDGLALADVAMAKHAAEKPEDKRSFYEISGKIINTTEETLVVPILRVTQLSSDGKPLKWIEFSEKGKTLAPGENMPFTTGDLDVYTLTSRFVLDLGNRLEINLRAKPHE